MSSVSTVRPSEEVSLAHGARIDRLDGVRAVAIGLVLTVHIGFLPMGWAGVHLFFVLSGLLITGILRRSRNDQSYWAPFYIKRATRILPPLAVAVLVTATVFSIPWRKLGLYYIFFAANFAEAFYRGESKTLGVMWSLAVEEQFYFFWPFAVRFLSRTQLMRLLILLLLVEPILRAVATPYFGTYWPIFFLTPFQLDGLAAGSLLSLLLESDSAIEWLRTWSAKLFLVSAVLFFSLSLFPVFHREANSVLFNSLGYSLIISMATFFIALVLLRQEALASKILAQRGVVFVGVISYGIYLFHPLIFELSGKFLQLIGFYHQKTVSPITVCVVVMVSWFSYRFYEQPIIRWGRRRAKGERNAVFSEHKNVLADSR